VTVCNSCKYHPWGSPEAISPKWVGTCGKGIKVSCHTHVMFDAYLILTPDGTIEDCPMYEEIVDPPPPVVNRYTKIMGRGII
jgi:hypothetical protein